MGLVDADTFLIRYCQISDNDQIDGGSSTARIETFDGGRLRLIESFKWDSQDGSGENIFQEMAESTPRAAGYAKSCEIFVEPS